MQKNLAIINETCIIEPSAKEMSEAISKKLGDTIMATEKMVAIDELADYADELLQAEHDWFEYDAAYVILTL